MPENFSIQTQLFNLEDVNDQIARFKVPIAFVGIANNFEFSKEVLESMKDSIKGAPVLTHFDGKQYGGHEDDLYKTSEGLKRTPELKPIGFSIYDKENIWWETFNIDGTEREYITTFVYLWKERYPYLKDLKNVWQSMEVQLDYETSNQSKIKKVTAAKFQAFALIGIPPAFSGSTFIKFSKEVNKLKKEFEMFGKYDDLDFTIPEGVKKQAQIGLDLRKEYKRGGTSVGLATARYLVKNNVASPEKVRHIAKFFPRHEGNNRDETNPPSNSRISWKLWGSDEGWRWSQKLVDAMNKRDEENMSDKLNKLDDDFSSKGSEYMDKIEFSLNSDQIRELMKNSLSEHKYQSGDYECCKYWVDTYDQEYVYVCDNETNKTLAMKYVMEDTSVNVDVTSAFEVIRGNFIPVNQKGGGTEVLNYKEMYAKIKEANSCHSMDNDTFAMVDDENKFAYVVSKEDMKKVPFILDENGEFVVDEEKVETMSNAMEMLMSFVKMFEMKDAEIGKAFAQITSLESALEDEKKIKEEREEEIKMLSEKLKEKEMTEKKMKAEEIMSKKEFSVFTKEEKEELVKDIETMSLELFETKLYSSFGKKVKDNVDFSDGATKFSFMHVGNPTVTNDNESSDIYAEIREKNKINK